MSVLTEESVTSHSRHFSRLGSSDKGELFKMILQSLQISLQYETQHDNNPFKITYAGGGWLISGILQHRYSDQVPGGASSDQHVVSQVPTLLNYDSKVREDILHVTSLLHSATLLRTQVSAAEGDWNTSPWRT